ncbi:DNA-binding transcriptional ArsR family regulator [Nocardioides sp. BE266]|uniref:ArsR/SmtB family transcription factor n=1 Tax=Nocardioides sp. BE266 TaxID=2817725 RepID=UPI0028604CF2|nr:metalloregulator ArsR/SmtB family transcription factor [Nocardioides sp. BE266]MDR7253088.1 DNA-binding transcriptional ArsR family regulator [Nocardioides sp. BE266]
MSERDRRTELPTDDQVDLAVEAFRMLADRRRIKILWALLHGESSVNELAERVGASSSVVSQHLAKLRLAGLVQVRREGTYAYYTAADEHVHRLLDEALFHADHANHPDQVAVVHRLHTDEAHGRDA